jgi:hypothetical protein
VTIDEYCCTTPTVMVLEHHAHRGGSSAVPNPGIFPQIGGFCSHSRLYDCDMIYSVTLQGYFDESDQV